ncbi:M14 family metallopeptidase [Roseococcus pinisoli]|uniref:Succinylglutamate desuccinylase/aspartoacylase family protein n=1 Tax=Roseococcus pinisoli TaxID=2835040 RepID=A0ABS5Q8F5_9PROT|nr:succinylglutamate desuccinylase/aspartoacylase family protein [Roseococcus pinisoli]MBS7809984.1 succinylglutamate desuccinylase/aspartoacylase family protein [Roseococcus pinisoli]
MKLHLPPTLDALLRGAGADWPGMRLAAPDLRRWWAGNVVPGVWSFDSGLPGLHVCLVALTHGNEIAGAVVLDRLLQEGLRPSRGRLTLIFANLDAFSRFEPDDPTSSRFLEEDLNRIWDPETLEGPRRSSEIRRARALRPVLDSADVVLDLHSMLWPSDPLFLAGTSEASIPLGVSLGEPPLVVADQGHKAGQRLIDHVAARGGRSLILEAGWHWEPETVVRMEKAARRLLSVTGVVPGALLPLPAPRVARVTQSVTVRGKDFTFVQPWRGGAIIPEAGTLIARDGTEEIRTPHADCLMVMPMLLAPPGQTAVRLARIDVPEKRSARQPRREGGASA